MALVEPLTKTFAELLPEVNVNHIADSSLIKEVIANNAVTPAVRRRLLQNEAKKAGRTVTLVEGLANGAFAAGQSGDGETHDRLIAEAAGRIADKVDAFVLAQGSMARME